ncbi:MAG: cation diffusion facilitator family transporter [Acidobacteria bacterium OLB17]|nr:MAG: cation diffusion facilitator family transporter [Acidobacteria bacterium OLB17]MCZ2391456.1 cation diffusion facilitator family transporter [Acidobacteriota bacterium]
MIDKKLTRYLWLSIAAAIATISLKAGAYLYTGSVGLLSDALESIINLIAAVFALWMLTVASRPPDEGHNFGHTKAEYFSGALEGSLIGMAAISIGWAAIERMISPQPLENIGIGIAISAAATVINLVVGQILIRSGRTHRSIALEADGRHLMTDVVTSIGVIAAVIIVGATGWLILDPLIALAVALNILWTGYHVVKRSAEGLMDASASDEDMAKIVAVLDEYKEKAGIDYHALRTRVAGPRIFVSVHVLMPDEWTIQRGHELAEEIESAMRSAVPGVIASTHLEPLDDPLSMADMDLV